VVQAWVVMNEAGAREAADASTARWKAGKPLSPIDGMPMGIKDLLETKDMPTQMGCKAYEGNFPKRDNAAVLALREAGAVILGKTTTAELGGSHPPATTNPFNPDHTPGGSSSGSAAAVGARMVPAAIGSQVGGSIIRPAGYCGNFALKPTQGGINRGERQATSMSTHGPHAGSVEDMWQVAIEIAMRAGGDPGRLGLFGPSTVPEARKPMTLAVMEAEGWTLLDDASKSAFETLIERIRAQGVTVLRRGDHPMVDAFEESMQGVQVLTNSITGWENHWGHRNLVNIDPDGVSQRIKNTLAAAEKLTPADYRSLILRREESALRHAALATVGGRVHRAGLAGSGAALAGRQAGGAPGAAPDGRCRLQHAELRARARRW
jgi:Asp-tRNA(Asn)/Glu-tRNA(Gln) amidotransferase A subunit family amidase